MIHISPAHPADAFEIDLRAEDLYEVALHGSPDWRMRLSRTLEGPGSRTGRDAKGRVLAVGGVALSPHMVAPWLLCSDLVAQHKSESWRFFKSFVAHLREHADGRLIGNYVPKDCPRNRAFLLALGFHILPSPAGLFDFFYLPHG